MDASTTQTVTMWAVVRFPSWPADECLWEFTPNQNTNAGSFSCFPGGGAGGNLPTAISRGNGTHYETAEWDQALLNDGKWHSLVVCYDKSQVAGEQIDLWSDGVKRTPTAVGGSPWEFAEEFANDTLYLGGRGGASLFAAYHLAFLAVTFRRPSTGETKAFHLNPWGPEAKVIRRYKTPEGGEEATDRPKFLNLMGCGI